jgi:hypothetical protein
MFQFSTACPLFDFVASTISSRILILATIDRAFQQEGWIAYDDKSCTAQIRAITGLELAAGVFTKCSDGLATQLNVSLTSGKRDSGPTEFRIGINGDVYGGMLAPIQVGKRRVDIAYVNPSAMVAMAYRGKGYYKQKMALRILGCFPSWDRIALVVSKDLAVKVAARHRSAEKFR